MDSINVSRDSITTKPRLFPFFSMIYITLVIASVILAHRISDYFGLVEPGGIFIFPLSYFLGDAMAEVYGYRLSRQLIWSSIFCIILFSALMSIVTNAPYPSYWHDAAAYNKVLGSSWWLFLGFIAGLLASDFTNIYLITKWKVILKGRYFWIRSIISTAICEMVFNIVTYTLNYTGYLSFNHIVMLIINSWLFKVGYSLIAVIPSMILVGYLKKHEKLDVYDKNTNFNPFSLK